MRLKSLVGVTIAVLAVVSSAAAAVEWGDCMRRAQLGACEPAECGRTLVVFLPKPGAAFAVGEAGSRARPLVTVVITPEKTLVAY